MAIFCKFYTSKFFLINCLKGKKVFLITPASILTLFFVSVIMNWMKT